MKRFGVFLSSTTLAIPVTFDPTTVMIRRSLVTSWPLKKSRLMTVSSNVRTLI